MDEIIVGLLAGIVGTILGFAIGVQVGLIKGCTRRIDELNELIEAHEEARDAMQRVVWLLSNQRRALALIDALLGARLISTLAAARILGTLQGEGVEDAED